MWRQVRSCRNDEETSERTRNQCAHCPQYLIEDAVLARVDEILGRVDGGTELEIIRYAA